MRKRSRGDLGFTLLEVLVVVAIIGTLAAISIPNVMTYLRFYRIRGASQQLSGAVQEARMKAIGKSSNYGTVFVIQDPKTYWVHLEDLQPPGNNLRAVVGAACTAGAGGQLDRQCLDMPAATTIPVPVPTQSTRYVLPDRVVFAAAAECTTAPPPTGAFNPTKSQLRFNRLGASCDPGTTNCVAAPMLGPAPANLIDNRASDSMICLGLRDLANLPTGTARWVTIARGGRVEEQR